MRGEGEASASKPYTVARYRLQLVCEASVPYDARPCDNPDRAAAFIRPIVEGYAQEVMGAVFLDVRNRAIGHTIAYVGTLSRLAVEPRGLLVPALLANASSVIIFHTHPSGDPSPSAEDLGFTEAVADAAAFLGLLLADHLIFGEGLPVDRGELLWLGDSPSRELPLPRAVAGNRFQERSAEDHLERDHRRDAGQDLRHRVSQRPGREGEVSRFPRSRPGH